MSDDALVPVNATSLTVEAQRQIRRRILSGSLRPGDALRDSVIAEQLSISRSPVREALRLLEQAGLVEKSAHRSYRVARAGLQDVPELAALRVADELTALRVLIARRADTGSLRPLVQQMHDTDLESRLVEADAQFHAAVVDLAGFPRLSARYATLSDQIRLALGMSQRPGGRAGQAFHSAHSDLLDVLEESIRTGQPEPVMSVWEHHVLSGLGALDLWETSATLSSPA